MQRGEGEHLARRRRLKILRNRLFRFGLLLAAATGFTIWGVLVFFDVGPNPSRATTNVSATVAPGDWAQGRRTPQNTGYTPDAAPVPEKVKWTYATSKPLTAAPAIAGGHVYLATEDGRTLALDRETGRPLWEYVSGLTSSSTPAVVGDLVIIVHKPGLVVALDRENGATRWEHHLRSFVSASPIVVNGTIYIGAGDEKLYALDAATGRQRWAFAVKDWIVSSVAYADGAVVVPSQDSLIHVVDTKTGRKRFVYDAGRPQFGAGPAIHGDTAYFTSLGGTVWAIDRRAITYPFERAFWRVKSNLYAWKMISNLPLQKGSLWASRVGGDIVYTPAVAHDTVYVANKRGEATALEGATGKVRWTTDLRVKITAAPTVAGGTVLIGTEDGTVFGLDAHGGDVLWEFKPGGAISVSPVVAGDAMYVVSEDGNLYSVTGAD